MTRLALPTVSDTLDDWIAEHPEFSLTVQRLHHLMRGERRNGLAFGALADHSLKRYSRQLNPAKLAQALTRLTGTNYSRETVNEYRDGYRMYRLWKQKSGGPPPHWAVTKLAMAWRSGPAHLDDDDKVELCRRAVEQGLTRQQMRDEALRLSTERTRARLTYDVTPMVSAVENIDALELLQSCEPQSVDLLHLDYQWPHGDYHTARQLPSVFIHDDPIAHLIEVLRIGREILRPHGVIALYGDCRSDPDERLSAAIKELNLRKVDQLVWQKRCGAFSHGNGTLFAPSHETIDFYRRADVPDSPRMAKYQTSVTQKWHSRSHRASSQPAVHPFEKPIELAKTIISAVTVNGLVIDPFAGSGSCGVAAVQLGCSYRGAELIPDYVEIANRRIVLAADREAETVEAINAALHGTTAEQHGAIAAHLAQAGIKLSERSQLLGAMT